MTVERRFDPPSPDLQRTSLSAHLRAHSPEIEQAILARAYAVSDTSEIEDPEYSLGLKTAIETGLAYNIAAIEAVGQEQPAPVPEQLLVQARAAARNHVRLDTVLRRYSAGHALLGDFILQAAESDDIVEGAELKAALRAVSATFDRLVASVSEVYAREADGRQRSTGARRAERVRMLLAGEPVDAEELNYELSGWHLGAVASGTGAVEALRDLAAALDSRLLLVRHDEQTAWAWLGDRQEISDREVLGLAKKSWPARVPLALGEPGEAIHGWRLSHRQAIAAMSVAQRSADQIVRYADVGLLASALRDGLLADSLRERYLSPLARERDGGAALRQTLHAYFAAGHIASSAAALLDVSRQTVSIRLRAVEERIDRPLEDCAAELEVALRLWDLGYPPTPGPKMHPTD
jgi:diguanylate cyclase with GGDEF domain/PucR-like helix-turn-helix protein